MLRCKRPPSRVFEPDRQRRTGPPPPKTLTLANPELDCVAIGLKRRTAATPKTSAAAKRCLRVGNGRRALERDCLSVCNCRATFQLRLLPRLAGSEGVINGIDT